MKRQLQKFAFSLLLIFISQHFIFAWNPAFPQDPGEYVGDLNFTCQADIDNYVDQDTAIVGNVTISGTDMTSLLPWTSPLLCRKFVKK